jgi:hypothetical protein
VIKKATWHYLLDVALGLLSLLLTVSSVFLWLVFPRGYHGARLFWVDIHKWGGLALGIGVLIHVLLHWKWILRMTRRTLGFGPRRGREIGIETEIETETRVRESLQAGGE